MGSLSAQDMVEHGGVTEATMGWHLQSNHYPPHRDCMIPLALQAVDAANEEDWDRELELPDEVESFRGRSVIKVHEAVEAFHLHAFINNEEEL